MAYYMADIKRRGPDVTVLAVSLTVRSVAKTGRLVVVDEAPLTGGFATAIAGMVAERGFWSLKAPIQRVARADVPVPYSTPLEKFITPDADKVEAAVRRSLVQQPPPSGTAATI